MLAAPGGEFWLGTDEYGRDLLSRLLYGARISLYIGLLAVGLGTTSGALVGLGVCIGGTAADIKIPKALQFFLMTDKLTLSPDAGTVIGAIAFITWRIVHSARKIRPERTTHDA